MYPKFILLFLFYFINPLTQAIMLLKNNHHHHYHELWSVRRSGCSLNLKVKLIFSSFNLASYVSPSCRFILQCLFGYPLCVHSFSVLQPIFRYCSISRKIFPKIFRGEHLRTKKGRVLHFEASIAEVRNVISIKFYIFRCRTMKKEIAGEFPFLSLCTVHYNSWFLSSLKHGSSHKELRSRFQKFPAWPAF